MIKNAIRFETTYSQVTDKTEKDRLTSLKPAEAHSQFINNSQCDHTSTSQQAKGVPIRTHYCVNVATQPFSRFFILILFAEVKLLLLVITTPLHSTVLLLSPRAYLRGNSKRKPKFSRIPRIRVISKDSDYNT